MSSYRACKFLGVTSSLSSPNLVTDVRGKKIEKDASDIDGMTSN